MSRWKSFAKLEILQVSVLCTSHVDIDECKDINNGTNPCHNGTCKNTEGSYECFCPPGYILDSSGIVCVG